MDYHAEQIADNRFQISVAYQDKLITLSRLSVSEEVADINFDRVSLEKAYYEVLSQKQWEVVTLFW